MELLQRKTTSKIQPANKKHVEKISYKIININIKFQVDQKKVQLQRKKNTSYLQYNISLQLFSDS